MNAALRQILTPARRPCGSLRVRVIGELCVLRCSGALWLATQRTLVVADLHLEKGSAYAARGQMLPPYDTRATLAGWRRRSTALKPGDGGPAGRQLPRHASPIGRLAADDRARLDRLAVGRDWVWMVGNHDREALTAADADACLPGEVVDDDAARRA